MPELRKDVITGRWVIISSERGKRPNDFKDQRDKKRTGFCPFCAGNERTTPREVLAYRGDGASIPDGPGWRLRVVPNKFPALQIEGDLNKAGDGIFDKMNGIAAHEVIIESPDHNATLATLPRRAMEEVLWAYRDRMEDLKKDTRFQYTLIFKNEGIIAGATLEHTHSQLIALPIVPIQVLEEIEGCKRHYDIKERCIFCDIIRQEMPDAHRHGNAALHSPCALCAALPLRDMDHAQEARLLLYLFDQRGLQGSCRPHAERPQPDRPGALESAVQLRDPYLAVPGRTQRLLPLAYRAHAQADERRRFRMGIGILHQSHPAGGRG